MQAYDITKLRYRASETIACMWTIINERKASITRGKSPDPHEGAALSILVEMTAHIGWQPQPGGPGPSFVLIRRRPLNIRSHWLVWTTFEHQVALSGVDDLWTLGRTNWWAHISTADPHSPGCSVAESGEVNDCLWDNEPIRTGWL